MAFKLADRVREFSTTTGVGPFFLNGAVVGYRTFLTAIGEGNTTFYAISLPGNAAWEVGVGSVGTGILNRDTVIASSTGGLVDFPTGTKDVFVTQPASATLYALSGTINAPAGALLPAASGGTGVATVEAEVVRLAASSNLQVFVDAADLSQLAADNVFTGDNTFAGVTVHGVAVFDGTGAVQITAGTTAQRPANAEALLRFNKDTKEFEGNDGTKWASVGGSAISNDTATATDLYPIMTGATSGTAANVYTSDGKLLYTPATGQFKANSVLAMKGIYYNAQVIDEDTLIPADVNAHSVGPLSVTADLVVDGNWVVL